MSHGPGVRAVCGGWNGLQATGSPSKACNLRSRKIRCHRVRRIVVVGLRVPGLAIGSLLPQTSGYRTESVRTTEVETSHVVATGATSAILPVIPPAEKMQYPPAAAEASASGEAADAGAPEGLVVVDASAAAGAQIKVTGQDGSARPR